ncbi:MAG: imelysin family protein [bacterium]|nr:imelysin family protein [bacterium]
MTFKRLSIIGLLAVLTLGTAVSCKPDPEPTPDFDKASLLTNIADSQIIPALDDFDTKLGTLETDYLAFQANPNATTLETVRNSWKNAYISWQKVKIYDFGPVRDYALKGATGTFPTDTTKINNNIASGSYTLGTAANVDAIGLPSLDYLLYRNDALNTLTNNANAMQYGLDVVQKMKTEVAAVKSQWSSYRSTFIASTGTETTSSFSEFVNEFNRDYELAKNAKVGIPIGKQSLDIALPEYIEARYSGISFDLLEASIIALKNAYTGGAGVGFDDYLLHLERSELNNTINANFDGILAKIDTFNGTLEEETANNWSEMNDLYTLLQGQVVYLKTDMTSAFGVLITYQDNDGD